MGYKVYYVAFLDILGFKKMVMSNTCEQIVDIYDSIHNGNLSFIKHCDRDIVEGNAVSYKVMSDSICVYIDKTSMNALYNIWMWCCLFQKKLISLDPPVLIRGAIVQGELYSENDVIFGPALTSAYMMEEKIARYPRIIASKELIERSDLDDETRNLIMRDVRIEKDYYISTDYLKIFYHGMDRTGRDKKIERIKDYAKTILSGESNEYQEVSIREKYIYLLEYCEYLTSS